MARGSTIPPLTFQNHTPHRLPTPEDDQHHRHLSNDRTDNTSVIQMLQTPRSIVRRASSPFVSRPVRRHTISGCSRRMGASVFSVSGSSVSALSSSLATLSDTTNVNGDVRHLPPDWEQQRDVPSTAPHGASASRAHGALPPHAATYERDPELPVGLGAQPSVDLGIVLEELSRRASRYCINLNKLVDRDERFTARHGSSALVYRGTLRPRGSKVAIKTFRLGPSNDAVPALKRVFQELHLWSKLSHENIVPLLGITTIFDFTVSIVSEWMGKGDAHSYIQNRSIDPRPLLVGIACGLNYLHCHPIFHGDLKGTNVLISDDGRALLCDFGLSFLVTSTFSMTVECRRGGSLP